jgi:predicted RND superfamily exporter protein
MHAFWTWLANKQHRRPWWFALGALCAVGLAMPFVLKLKLNSDWTALLPDNKPSVQDLKVVRSRLAGLSTLTIAIESKDVPAMKRFATDLAPRLEALQAQGVRRVDWNVRAYEEFVDRYKHLFVSLQDLEEVRDKLQERLDYERMKKNPFFINLSDDPPPDLQQLLTDFKEKNDKKRKSRERFPDGFYLHPNGDLLALFVRTDTTNVESGDALYRAVRDEVRSLGPSRYAADLRVRYAGDLVGAREEHDAIVRELAVATSLTIVLVLLSIYWLFRSVRSIAMLGLSLVVPVAVTFGLAQGIVGYLNTSTSFLGSIVVGNGVNPLIIWLARYFEERRGGADVPTSVARTHEGTWLATLTACLAAAAAYGSLMVTDFRGFRDFGIIGGIGMLMAWLATVLVLPSVATLLDRGRRLSTRVTDSEHGYGVLLWSYVIRYPRWIVGSSLLMTALSAVMVVVAVRKDPREYNFRNLRSDRKSNTEHSQINKRVSEIVGKVGSGMALSLLAPSASEAEKLKLQLEERRRNGAPWGKVRSMTDLLPADQEEKIPVLSEIRASLLTFRKYASEQDAKTIDQYLPPEHVEPARVEQLPDTVTRPFTEKNGERGRIVLVEERENSSQWDGKYLVEWTQALRSITLSDGSRPVLAGRAPVFADMIEVVWTDGPRVMAVSILLTCLSVLVSFRRIPQLAFAIGSLLLGVLWMAGWMALFEVKINFLNFVAFPITFGIGVDYAVNVMRRYVLERQAGASMHDALRESIQETGGAVVLCSLTTIIGYISLFASANKALNSFGLAMTISELTCLGAATVTLPALLLLVARSRGSVIAEDERLAQHHPTVQR